MFRRLKTLTTLVVPALAAQAAWSQGPSYAPPPDTYYEMQPVAAGHLKLRLPHDVKRKFHPRDLGPQTARSLSE